MATAAEVLTRVPGYFEDIGAELDFLPELAEQWESESIHTRLDYMLEWDELMDRLTILDQAYRSDIMTPAQQDQFDALLRKFRALHPVIQRLELYVPPIAVE